MLACALAVPAVRAQAPLSDEAKKAILAYELTLPRAHQLIAAMGAMTTHLVSLPDFQDRMAKSMKMTTAEQKAQMAADPKATAILKANKLTVDEYLVGVPALRMALMVAQGLPQSANVVASPANVTFAKAHLAELKPKMDAVGDALRPKK
jgi:hypothetical protein